MKIGIFVLTAGRQAGGPETYEVELIRGLARIDRKNEYFIYCLGQAAERAIGVKQENFVFRQLWPPFRPVQVAASLAVMLMRDGVDFYHATFTPGLLSPKPLVYTVHCLSSIAHPEFFRSSVARRLNYLLRKGIREAAVLPCVSRFTMGHVHEMFGVDFNKLALTYNGVGPEFSPAPMDAARAQASRALGFAGPYVLYLGKLQKHKNLARLVRAFSAMKHKTGSPLKLALAGRRMGPFEELDAAIAQSPFAQDIYETGYIRSEDRPSVYRAAELFVFPSLWEGFGLPVVEAMACGTPVVTANTTCLPEIAGGCAQLVDPYSEEELAGAMSNVATDEPLRRRMIEAGLVRAKDFDWDACARATLAAYERVG